MFYLKVNWDGNEGIFCAKDGRSFKKETGHTVKEMSDILGVYYPLVGARSVEMTPDDVLEYANCFMPLDEFQNEYGVAVRGINEDVS